MSGSHFFYGGDSQNEGDFWLAWLAWLAFDGAQAHAGAIFL